MELRVLPGVPLASSAGPTARAVDGWWGLIVPAGTGGQPEKGELAAQESHQELAAAMAGADMVRTLRVFLRFV